MAQLLPLFRFLQAAVHHASRPPPPEAPPTSPPSTAQPANRADPLAMILAGCTVPAAEASSRANANAVTAGSAAAGTGAQAAPAASELPPATASSDGSGLEDMDEDEDMEEEVEIEDDAGESHLWVFIVLACCCSLQSSEHCTVRIRVCMFTQLRCLIQCFTMLCLHPKSSKVQAPFVGSCSFTACFALLCIFANAALTHRQYATRICSSLPQSHLCLQGYCYACTL